MKNTFSLLILILMHALGTSFTLLMMYASPDDIPKTLEASLFFLGTSIILFSLFYHVSFKEEQDNILKYSYILLGISFIAYGIILTLIIQYASPDMTKAIDYNAMLLFILSTLIILIGYIFMFKHHTLETIDA